jgi:hypothetical protein
MKTIVIGSGGREHAIAWALASSKIVDEVVCIPGNGGTARERKCRNIPISVADIASVADACARELACDPAGSLVVVGPEDPSRPAYPTFSPSVVFASSARAARARPSRRARTSQSDSWKIRGRLREKRNPR